jgi:polyhydroxybutyrate depolymerase
MAPTNFLDHPEGKRMVRPLAGMLATAALLSLAAAGVAAQTAESRTLQPQQGDRERAYRLYRPATLDRHAPVPLVIMLHGGFGSGAQAERAYRWNAQANRGSFVVAYPDGIGRSWNAGGICCGPALREGVDDVGFLNRLIDAVAQAENIDRRRVYLTGMSNGAAMAYRYACEGSAPVAAIGPVAGTLSFACAAPRPTSVMAIHGLADQHVPFIGGPGTQGVTKVNWVPVAQTLEAFRKAGGCQAGVIHRQGLVETSTAPCEQGRDVVLTTIDGAGHQWPGSEPRSGLAGRLFQGDPPSTALDATEALWAFFRSHPAPP